MIVKNIPNDIVKKCFDFSNEVFETNKDKYSERGQYNSELIKRQTACGKICEYAVWIMLCKNGIYCDEPDCIVYKKNKKTFSADLSFEGNYFHVKSCSAKIARRFGLSWVFQKEDPLITQTSENDYISLVLLNDDCIDNIEADIKCFCKFNLIKHLIKPTRKKFSYDNKCAIYFDDIKKIDNNLLYKKPQVKTFNI